MDETLDRVFLKYSAEKLNQLAGRVEYCLGRLTPDQIWLRGNENQNAVGNLILHMCGNLGQWIVSGIGGAPDNLVRDSEFAARGGADTAQLVELLKARVAEAVGTLETLTPERLLERTNLQRYNVTFLEAIYHVVCHFEEHTGQILFATKLMTAEDLGFYKHLNKATHSEKTP